MYILTYVYAVHLLFYGTELSGYLLNYFIHSYDIVMSKMWHYLKIYKIPAIHMSHVQINVSLFSKHLKKNIQKTFLGDNKITV